MKTSIIITLIIIISYNILIQAQDVDDIDKLLSLPLLSNEPDYTCPVPKDPKKKLNDFHLRGTALGGWLVLEPWITPSLFYQFLGKKKKH